MSISDVTDNRADYPGDKVPKYEKLEVTFQIQDTVAQNLQFPYDPSPPPGVDPEDPASQGITANAVFTPDDWQTSFVQPAFFYQDFIEGQVNGREWYYPTGDFVWKVRFSPHVPGTWQYKLVAEDASGYVESPTISFEVVDSTHRGFVTTSPVDGRYFEYDNGQLFYPLGFNTGINLADPVLGNEDAFLTYQQNGINIIRTWISSLYGTAWLEWLGGRNMYDGYLPRPGILPFFDPIRDRYTLALLIDYEADGDTGWFDACRFQFRSDPEAVKPNTTYRLRIKYWGKNITGLRNSSQPDYGLVGKIGGGWEVNCFEPGTSTVVTDYGGSTSDWSYVEGTWHSGDHSFLPKIYLGLENVTKGRAYIDSVSLREELGDGKFGPEIIAEPSMHYDLYFPEQGAHALDKIVELAGEYGVYLKLVIHEKNDTIFFNLDDDGTYVYGEEGDNFDGFYGIGRDVNKIRWLQQAWWRYLQARWGYSTAIHSWELTNEGDPWNSNHWALADELAKFMKCRIFGVPVGRGDGEACEYDHPNSHMVSTSFWHSFPEEQFWASAAYPNIDYADVHAYVSTGWLENSAYEDDAALFHIDYSAELRSNIDYFTSQNDLPTKPTLRGETGIDFIDAQAENQDLALDVHGVWLHNFLWAGLHPGAMTELYWWREFTDSQPGPDGQTGLHEVYRYLRDFVRNIPLANGSYQDANAELTDPNLRVVGQKDAVNGRAHLWVQNTRHTWRNVVDGAFGLAGLSGTLTINGFAPRTTYDVEWHEFNTQGVPEIQYSSVTSDGNGNIALNLPTKPHVTDVAIKIGDY
jgi:hypothetical protein